MERREDLETILAYLPLEIQGFSLSWPSSHLVDVLEALTKGPSHSRVDSGTTLSGCISEIRKSLSLTSHFSDSALQGYALFFDEKMSKEESSRWFNEVLPAMACLLLRFPSLLELHYLNSENLINGVETGVRVLSSNKAGIVFLSQELIGALLSCSFFCLFPVDDRGSNRLPNINFDKLFGSLISTGRNEHQENKIRCITHYFQRISSCIPPGFVSFERKILSIESGLVPDEEFWSTSSVNLCPVEVHTSGLIEDQSVEALEVDFANKYLGGGALRKGCVQEEIRFMINPELIAGMLFLPAMEVSEAIELVGAERFSHYAGFTGDYIDTKERDVFGRRKTRIIAIDALRHPGISQYKPECLLREANKALCGFLHVCKNQCIDHEDGVGVATGNWGCGAYGGDPEVKSLLQWIAVSQARRPFMSYYTFGLEALHNLNQVTELVISKGWRVGDLWTKLVEYSNQRLRSNRKRREPRVAQHGVTVCKVDAAWDATSKKCGIGGLFSGTSTMSLPQISEAHSHVSSALMAEAIAVHRAVSLAVFSNVRSLTVLSDSLSLIKLLKKEEYQPELFGIMFDIYHYVSYFDVISFSFISRSYNAEADLVAKSVLALSVRNSIDGA